MGQVNCCRGSRDDPEPVQQCVPISALGEPLLRQQVQVTLGCATKKRDLLLFSRSLVIAKPQRGSAPRPQLCLALCRLQVLGSGKGAAGDAAEEEEGENTSSLVLVWPCGSCIVTFCCRAVKQLWLSTLLAPPEGVEGARVTQLPSFNVLMKELRGRNAAMTLDTMSLEQLLEDQAKAGAEQRPPPGVPSGSPSGVGHSAAGRTSTRRRGLPRPFLRRVMPGCVHKGLLFGRPLAALCSQDGTLPQTIQDLLALLHQHGPSTEGIFLVTASERATQELREALDSGAEVHLESQPLHLLAVILQDFLRKIPSQLLQAELYQEWMSAVLKTSRQERMAGLKEVASKLPKANLLLLKDLLSLLHAISSNATTTRMTARKLAVCLGTVLLSPPEEDMLPVDVLVEVMKVTGLVQLLIEHYGELFEEEEEQAGLARASAEELPVPEADTETSEGTGPRQLFEEEEGQAGESLTPEAPAETSEVV
nr:T-cell activation Rho GTPase-activating protein-like [Columba livia]